MTLSKKERCGSMRQAIANSDIEGHVPRPEFLADCEAVVTGRMTHEQLRARSLVRALAPDVVGEKDVKPRAA